jgi:alpha-1,3-rhamnosyl/mannosyltransferase
VVELIVDGSAPIDGLPAGALVHQVALGRPTLEAAASGSRRTIRDVLRAGDAARSSPLDVMLFPSVHTWFPVRGVPTVVGVHDAIAKRYPSLTSASRSGRLAWAIKERAAIRSAARIFSVSEAARADVAQGFGLDPARIEVVPEAPEAVFAPPPPGEVVAALGPLGLVAAGFILCAPGGISPHKDVETAIRAYGALRDRRPGAPRLAIVGPLAGDGYLSSAGALVGLIARLGLEDSVTLTGYVPDATLAALYAGALVVVNPSRAEGFGLPAVEAAACGAAVVLSDIPPHRETLGEGAVFFPPGDASLLAERLEQLLDADGERAAVAARCRAAVGHLTWEATAERLSELLMEAAR